MGKNRSPEPVFELPAHFTEWSGREGGPVGRPLARLWPPFGRARAALRAATCPEGRPERRRAARAGLAALRAALRAAPFSKGGPSGGPFSVRAALILRVAALLPHGRPPRPPWAAHRPSGGHIRAALNLRVAALRAARRPRRGGPAARSGRPILGGGRPLLVGGPPDFGRRAARFGGWAAPVAAGRPAHHLRPIRPLT